jgi:hypothetical protein
MEKIDNVTLVSEKNANFSPKIVLITSTPDSPKQLAISTQNAFCAQS